MNLNSAATVALLATITTPGEYALVFTHNRDGKNKFGFLADGAGLASNQRLGRS